MSALPETHQNCGCYIGMHLRRCDCRQQCGQLKSYDFRKLPNFSAIMAMPVATSHMVALERVWTKHAKLTHSTFLPLCKPAKTIWTGRNECLSKILFLLSACPLQYDLATDPSTTPSSIAATAPNLAQTRRHELNAQNAMYPITPSTMPSSVPFTWPPNCPRWSSQE